MTQKLLLVFYSVPAQHHPYVLLDENLLRKIARNDWLVRSDTKHSWALIIAVKSGFDTRNLVIQLS